jgi:hypothetical protein
MALTSGASVLTGRKRRREGEEDGDGLTAEKGVGLDLLATLRFQQLLWPPQLMDDANMVKAWNGAIATALDALEIEQQAFNGGATRLRKSGIDCSKWYSDVPEWDQTHDDNMWAVVEISRGPIYAWLAATNSGIMTIDNSRRMFYVLVGRLGCGTSDILNHIDETGNTILMHLLGNNVDRSLIESMLTHPLVRLDACVTVASATRTIRQTPINAAWPAINAAWPDRFPSALHVALESNHCESMILAHLTDQQLATLIANDTNIFRPMLLCAMPCMDSQGVIFAALLNRIICILSPSGQCAGALTVSQREHDEEEDMDDGTPKCRLCVTLNTVTGRGETLLTEALWSNHWVDKIWSVLVARFEASPSNSCVARLFRRHCWRMSRPLHSLHDNGNSFDDCRIAWTFQNTASNAGWFLWDPVRTAIHCGREKYAIWLIATCLPEWALDAYDCGGRTLLMRAVAHPDILQVGIIHALLQRVPQLDVTMREIVLDDGKSAALLLPSSTRPGHDAAELMAQRHGTPTPDTRLVSNLLVVAIRAQTHYRDTALSSVMLLLSNHHDTHTNQDARQHEDAHALGGQQSPILFPDLSRLVCAYAKLVH